MTDTNNPMGMGAHVIGHVIPGVFGIIFGLWWIVQSFWLHLTTTNNNGSGNKNCKGRNSANGYSDFKREVRLGRLSYIPQPFCTRIPFESLAKLLSGLFGLIVEGLIGEGKDGKVTFQVNRLYAADGTLRSITTLHHKTMCAVIMVSGLVDIIGLFVRLPRNMTKIFTSMIFFVSAILFSFHTEFVLETTVHTLLVMCLIICTIMSLLRIIQPANVLINSFLGIAILISGTWLINLTDIAYSKKVIWNEGFVHEQVMFAVAIFNWHVIGDTLFSLFVYIAMSVCIKFRKQHKDGSKTILWPSLPIRKGVGSPEAEEEIKLMPV